MNASMNTTPAPRTSKKVSPAMTNATAYGSLPYRFLTPAELTKKVGCLGCHKAAHIASEKGVKFCDTVCMDLALAELQGEPLATLSARKLSANHLDELVYAYEENGHFAAVTQTQQDKEHVFGVDVRLISIWKNGKLVAREKQTAAQDTLPTSDAGSSASDLESSDAGRTNNDFVPAESNDTTEDMTEDTQETLMTAAPVYSITPSAPISLEELANEVTPILPKKKGRNVRKETLAATEPFVTTQTSPAPVMEEAPAKSYLADTSIPVDLATGQPVDPNATEALETKTKGKVKAEKAEKTEAAPAEPKYVVVFRRTDPTLGDTAVETRGATLASDKEAFKSLVVIAEAIRTQTKEAEETLIGCFETGYVLLNRDLRKVGELHIGDITTHHPVLIDPPGRPTSAIHPERLYKAAHSKAKLAVQQAMSAYLETPGMLAQKEVTRCMETLNLLASQGTSAFELKIHRATDPVKALEIAANTGA